MGLILPLVFLGLMASLSPATIVVFVLVLGTARARVNAVGFLFGWGLSVTIVFVGSYVLADSGASQTEGGRTSVAVLQILLGSAMLVVAVRVWRRGETAPSTTVPSRWGADRLLGHMEGLTPGRCRGRRHSQATLGDHHGGGAGRGAPPHHRPAAGSLPSPCSRSPRRRPSALMFVYYSRYPGEAQTQLAVLRDRVVAAGPAVGALAGMLVGGFLIVDGLLGLT